MITIRKAEDRGHADHGWLDSRHSFSFANYYDPAHMGYGALRVINDDRVAPGAGFDTHGHRDMEIVSYVVDGVLEHKDSLGHGSGIRPGEVQRMSAGTGIRHSEFNGSGTEPVRFLQIWILPEENGGEPGYEQKDFPKTDRADSLTLVASRDGRDGSVTVGQDVNLYSGLLTPGATATYTPPTGRKTWVQVVKGSVGLNGTGLGEGDGAAIEDETTLTFTAETDAEFLVFDLA